MGKVNNPAVGANPAIGALINTDTGEIIKEIYSGDKVKITRQEQIEYISTHETNFNGGESFAKVYDDVIPLLEEYLTLPEFKFLFSLITHMCYEDCILRRTHDRRSSYLTTRMFADIHGYKYNNARKIMLMLRKKGIVGKHNATDILGIDAGDETVYTLNPFIFFRGTDIINTVYSYYSNLGWEKLLVSGGEKPVD